MYKKVLILTAIFFSFSAFAQILIEEEDFITQEKNQRVVVTGEDSSLFWACSPSGLYILMYIQADEFLGSGDGDSLSVQWRVDGFEPFTNESADPMGDGTLVSVHLQRGMIPALQMMESKKSDGVFAIRIFDYQGVGHDFQFSYDASLLRDSLNKLVCEEEEGVIGFAGASVAFPYKSRKDNPTLVKDFFEERGFPATLKESSKTIEGLEFMDLYKVIEIDSLNAHIYFSIRDGNKVSSLAFIRSTNSQAHILLGELSEMLNN